MQLIIVESPTKAKTLSRFLGKDFVVEATYGHLKDLPKSTLGIDLKHNFKPQYDVVAKRAETIKDLLSKSKKAKQIFLATDPDREGEAIAKHAHEILGGEVKRIAFHEITKEAVEEAIADPRSIDKNLVDAQIARRVLDRLVGYKLSPLLWRKVRRGLSAGRVQTVTVRLIVEKEREIEAFKAREYWEISALVKPKTKKEFLVQLVKLEVKNKAQADKIITALKKATYKVFSVNKHEVVKNPYPPFTTSTLTQAGSRLFGWSAKRTMSIAQGLYEEGLITYHRTDSMNLSLAAIEKARAFIQKEYGEKYSPEKPRFYKTTSRVAQEAHEAIRPTSVGRDPGSLDQAPEVKRLYELVWKRFVACQMTAAVYDETTIDVEAKNLTRQVNGASTWRVYSLRAGGQIMKFPGWRKLFPTSNEEIILPEVIEGEALQLIKVSGDQKFTQPPARYTEASLIKTLEKLGIGRPSTYAPTISTIQVRNYVEKNEGKFSPTLVGVAVNDFLLKNFPDLFEYAFTAEMEDDLDKIANGQKEWEKTIGVFWNPFSKKLKVVTEKSKRVKIGVEKLGKACPECKRGGLPRAKRGELVVRLGRFGKFISCSRFPDCKYTEKYIEKTGVKCPDCEKRGLPRAQRGDVIIKKSGRGRKFFGCSRYPDCQWASWKNPKKEKEEIDSKN